jgi:hypothetical protein
MKRLRVLHLEDAFLVRSAVEASGIAADILPA